jgi:hypothetical protein
MTTETTQQPELFTVIYTDSWASCGKWHTATKMIRCVREREETVLGMLSRYGIQDSAVFIFHGNPKLQGE